VLGWLKINKCWALSIPLFPERFLGMWLHALPLLRCGRS
jgi:hypothetical protein